MKVVRPIEPQDLDQFVELVEHRRAGLTTLQRSGEFLEKLIRESAEAFKKVDGDSPRGETYRFVLEDLETGRVIGTSGIVSKVGGFAPFYAYRIEKSMRESKSLGVRKEIPVLHLVTEHDGPCEIGSLFLNPEHRGAGNGRLLSLARFMFMAEHPDFFDPRVIAEIRGIITDDGASPFWDALGKHFFEVDFETADDMSAVDKQFIADLMPEHPIYIPLLPPAAQAVIGEPNKLSAPAKRMLEAEGFEFAQMVDIFEAGPVMACARDEIRAIRESRTAKVAELRDAAGKEGECLICTSDKPFRLCRGPIKFVGESEVELTRRTALVLDVKLGDTVRYVAIRPKTKDAKST